MKALPKHREEKRGENKKIKGFSGAMKTNAYFVHSSLPVPMMSSPLLRGSSGKSLLSFSTVFDSLSEGQLQVQVGHSFRVRPDPDGE